MALSPPFLQRGFPFALVPRFFVYRCHDYLQAIAAGIKSLAFTAGDEYKRIGRLRDAIGTDDRIQLGVSVAGAKKRAGATL